jgi:hypothetical protein
VSDEPSGEFLGNELSVLTDEVIGDRCGDEAIAHVLSQLKEEHVVSALSCYDVLVLDSEHLRFIRHKA